uniref:LIM zinc-binding domain-containing protein n=1 Tax=Glossina brevipalpis TaxID=37001 RepID=A0A1A9WKM2_9MUSC
MFKFYSNMDELDEHLRQLSLINGQVGQVNRNGNSDDGCDGVCNTVVEKKAEQTMMTTLPPNTASTNLFLMTNLPRKDNSVLSSPVINNANKKVGPLVPPKPQKKQLTAPEIPQSSLVKQTCEPLYSQRLQNLDNSNNSRNIDDCIYNLKNDSTDCDDISSSTKTSMLLRKQPIHSAQCLSNKSTVTLDNPIVLEQQLEALAHHKKQLEKRGKLLFNPVAPVQSSLSGIPKLSSTSLLAFKHNESYSENLQTTCPNIGMDNLPRDANVYSNVLQNRQTPIQMLTSPKQSITTTNLLYEKNNLSGEALQASQLIDVTRDEAKDFFNIPDEEVPPPSPVSSSYSELRRATAVFKINNSRDSIRPCSTKEPSDVAKPVPGYGQHNAMNYATAANDKLKSAANQQFYVNKAYNNDYKSYNPMSQQGNKRNVSDYYGYGGFSQSSSTYESIYEPINPRPLSSRSNNYAMYAPCIKNSNGMTPMPECAGALVNTNNSNLISFDRTCDANTPIYINNDATMMQQNLNYKNPKEGEVEAISDFLAESMDSSSDIEGYGVCFKCNERVVGENSGCTAMDQIYHIACFTCSQCQINLQGKAFYALEDKPYCEYDYLQTLEKCSVCMKPILERILRATGKPYHPQCFTCVVCRKSLDGIPFTVDATNQNYCIEDFHKKFAPRCCVCKNPIMPEPGEEETVRVVALDRSFHFECYKCEDCGLLLSSEAEGRGCYPLDDHVLCKSCNAKRVQMLTSRMTTDL